MTIETFDPKVVAPVTMTDSAIRYMAKQLEQSANAIGIRLGVKKSGCSGFKYDIELISEVNTDDHAIPINDSITLYIAADAQSFVRGTEIDFVREGLNSTIKFNNPNAKDLCGCGESFSV